MVNDEFEHEYDLEYLQLIAPRKRNFRMLVAPRYRVHFCEGTFEEFTSDLLLNFGSDNMLFIDIGAHYGYYTILAGTKYPNCRIMSFEPVPDNYEILRRNVELNHLQNVEIHNLALSNRNESRKLQVTEASDSCSFYGHPLTKTIKEIQVETVCLDNFLNEIPQVPIIIKIDTEGHEIAVLEGMKDILVNSKDIRLVVEFNPECLIKAGCNPTSLLEKLSQFGFDIYFIADNRRITYKLDENALSRWRDHLPEEYDTRRYANMLCVKKQKSLSVCLFSHSSQLAGAERSLLELTSELIKDHGVVCTVILPSEGPLKLRLEEAGASTIVMNLPWWCDSSLPEESELKAKFNSAFTGLIDDLKRYLNKINPDVVVTNTMVITWGAIAASLLDKPHAWFIHEFGQLGKYSFTFYLPFQRTLDIINDSSNLILTNSDAVKNKLFGNSSLDSIQTVYCHISIPDDKPDCGDIIHFNRPNAIRIAVLGSITESKGQEDAVSAIKELVARKKDVELIIAGMANENYRSKLTTMVIEESLEAYVQFKDFTENPYPIIGQADIILVCSRNEAFGRVTLEAMLMKKPVIGTNAGGTPELIKDGYNGILYEPGDYKQLANKIEYLIENKDKMIELGSNGYIFAQDVFTKEKFGGRVYQLLLNLKGTPNPLASPYSHFITGLMLDTLSDFQEKTESKDSRIAKLNSALQAKDSRIAELNSALQAKDSRMAELNSALQAKDSRINSLNMQIEQMHRGVALQLLGRYRRVVNKVLGTGTRRRHYYELLMKGIRIILNEGLRSFFRKFRNWLRQRRLAKKIKMTPLPKFEPSISKKEAAGLTFPQPLTRPVVSIVIPVYNKWRYTINCLKSVCEHTEGDYEIIVVDDASTDDTPNILSKIHNLHVIRNEGNSGFVASCNKGAATSRGNYILFLNNDTMVSENWLEPLLKLIRRDDVGAVGCKLVYPDGTLQEAGGIIWSSGYGWNYGRGDNADKPEYNYVREVDYCSGACLLVKRELFERLQGFDERFKPGYYEDTDLCFSLRSLGYKVMYQPMSVVVHFEGVTSGTDTSAGIKSYQEINRQKFIEKWHDVLSKSHYLHDPTNVFAARERNRGQRILIIDHYVPTYDKDSGSLRMFNILKILLELGHRVTFVGDNLLRMEPYTEDLQREGIEVIYAPYVLSVEDYVRKFGNYFNVIILSRPHIAIKYIDLVKTACRSARIVYDTVDLAFLRESRRARIEHSDEVLGQAEELKTKDLYLARNSDVTLVVSPAEKDLLLKEDPSLNIEIVSNIHHVTQPAKPSSEREDILFVGGFDHIPNVDAVTFFVKDIFPLIKQKLPNLRLYIVGSNPPPQVMSLHSRDVEITGYVKDLTPYFEKARVFVAPLRYGAGVKGKINQSMSYGLPVVTTTIGAEGIGLVDGVDALIADEPGEFAEKVAMLYKNESLWNKLSENSIKNIQEHFSYEVAKKKLARIFSALPVTEMHENCTN